MPSFFSDGNTPAIRDTKWRILQKILGALTGSGGGGGGLGNQEIFPAGTATPDDITQPALRYTGTAPTPMEQWDPVSQQWV